MCGSESHLPPLVSAAPGAVFFRPPACGPPWTYLRGLTPYTIYSKYSKALSWAYAPTLEVPGRLRFEGLERPQRFLLLPISSKLLKRLKSPLGRELPRGGSNFEHTSLQLQSTRYLTATSWPTSGACPKNGRASIQPLLTGLQIWESAGLTSELSANHPSFGAARRRIHLWRLTPSSRKSAKSLIVTSWPTGAGCGPPANIRREGDEIPFPLWTEWTKWTEYPTPAAPGQYWGTPHRPTAAPPPTRCPLWPHQRPQERRCPAP